ncbi:hypothetical protein [Caballeronia sp. Sq4a]|uniref:hypothetical protein n=1 Tax=Caballeronia sp. Sq4a TaxID=2878152 RepID=UPI0020BE50C0|nr:hypothetical protein [Caballeronia sp. Sq4a]
MDWFRLYGEFANDPKVQSMSEAMQRRLVMLMCLRCSNVLATLQDDELAFALRIDEAELAQTKALFMRKGFIDEQWDLINWDKRQYVSDSSTERSRKHRNKKREQVQQACNVAATPPEADTEAEAETETEQPQEAKVVDQSIAPEQTQNLASPVSRSTEIAVYLRQRGIVGSNSANPNISAWGDDARVTNEILDAALSVVASRQMNPMPGPNYLAPIIRDLLAQKTAPPTAGTSKPQKFDPVAYVNRNRPSPSDERTHDCIDVEAKQVA